jgi:hypothetical protein
MHLHYAYSEGAFFFEVFMDTTLTTDQIEEAKMEFAGDSLKIVGAPPSQASNVTKSMSYDESVRSLGQ